MNPSIRSLATQGACVLALAGAMAQTASAAALGQTMLPPSGDDAPVTVYYPSEAPEQPVRRGRVVLRLAVDAPALDGNGRLIVISHGSGGSPWVHADLARALVDAGYVVALPEHRGDNYRDDSRPGPDSWTLRPAEVSRAIDSIARDSRFAALLQLDKVGVYGMSAGGHTALTLAGGRWSPARFARHCAAHIAEDFPACVGLLMHLTGGPLDGLKQWLAVQVIRLRFDDERLRQHHDPRVAAVVAAVPAAADYDLSSLAVPRVPLALVLAAKDRWLAPRFHGDAVRSACPTCEVIADMATAGHGAMLSPLPAGIGGIAGELLNDPPGFDRSRMPEIDRRIAAFFARTLPARSVGADPGNDVRPWPGQASSAAFLAFVGPAQAPASVKSMCDELKRRRGFAGEPGARSQPAFGSSVRRRRCTSALATISPWLAKASWFSSTAARS